MSEYVGKRVSVRDDLGTICYYGPVDGASGLWLGIDWDIPERGKHDGSKDGKRYFSSRFPSSGSFLRLSPQVQFGRPFIVALLDKYVESYHGSQPESVILGSSNGSIQVEAVNLDKIRAKFSNVGRLKEISLHGELVSFAGEQPDEIKETCASVRGLDLSKNLLADWGVISQITTHIPTLLRLSLNQNRLATLSEQVIPLMRNGFPHLQELQLNGTLINWSEMQCLTAYMPTLHSIELGYNQLHTVSGDQPPPQLAPLSSVNFDSNSLKDWVNVIGAIRQYTNVERLVLSSNCIDYIPNLHDDMVAVGHIKHLILAHNRLSDWECVDNLSTWCPNLESASFIGNPFLVDTQNYLTFHFRQDPEILKVARSLIVAKIPSLVALDGTAISPQERNDSELYYLSYITAHQHPRLQDTHPQWARLRKSTKPLHFILSLLEHGFENDVPNDGGRPSVTAPLAPADTLGSQLFAFNLHFLLLSKGTVVPATFHPSLSQTLETARALPTMTMKVLRLKIAKTWKQLLTREPSLKSGRLDGVWLRMKDDTLSELDHSRDGQDLSWIGIEENSDVVIFVTQTL